jgi:hypothetical protein
MDKKALREGFFNQFKNEEEFAAFVDILKDVVKEALLEIEEPPSRDILDERVTKRAMMKEAEGRLDIPKSTRKYPYIYAKWRRGPESSSKE